MLRREKETSTQPQKGISNTSKEAQTETYLEKQRDIPWEASNTAGHTLREECRRLSETPLGSHALLKETL